MPDLTRRRLHAAALTTVLLGASGAARPTLAKDRTMSNDDTALHVPAQVIPPPKSISPQGQAFLAAAAKRIAERSRAGGPPPSTEAQSAAAVQFLRPRAAGFKGSLEEIALPSGAKLYRVVPEGRKGRLAEVVYMDIHGGGFISGGGEMCRLLATLRAQDYGAEVYSVDYRLAPEHPFPAGLDDCMAAYREILKRHKATDLVVGGSSAGGNLAAGLMLRARDEGLPLPVALVLLTPALDMTHSGDSVLTNRYLDVNLHGGGGEGPNAYAAGSDPTTPYLSPLFGDFTKGWPPTILASGTRDLLLSDTVRMHRALRRAGVAAELHVTEAGPHGGFMGGAPEDADVISECRRFVYSGWGLPG
ncbi:alpha/beta hydrolase fold domain-containing protein [Phenylobacterium sp. LjRoot225]|uniref:alpha/beta hydrolase fold domain-containing protein n=1 Tax=Phenylobacterium sp. LjRoot225 TaxID=3342285 RepID=UPI003ECCAEC7